MRAILPIVLTATAANAWRLAFYLGSDCMGEELSTVSYPDGSACSKLSSSTTNFESVLASRDSSNDDNYEVALYDSDDCIGETLGVISDDSVCYPDRDSKLKAYRVQAINKKRGLKRSPVEVTRDVDAWLKRQSTGLAARSQESDLDLAIAKSHPNITALVAASSDVSNYHTYVSASIFAISSIGTALSFTSLVSGCIGVGNAAPVPYLSCVASIIATCLSFLVSSYHAYENLKNIRVTLRNNNVELGIRRGRGNRRSIDDRMVMSQEEYMSLMLHNAGLNATHIGYHDRESTNSTSPAFHFHGEDGQQFVYTISPNVHGEVRHSFSFHDDTKIEKRQGYQGVTIAGGLDVEACQRKNSNYGDLPTSARSAYNYYVKDLRCLLSNADLSKNYLNSDVFDKSGNSALTVGISTFRGSSKNEVADRAACLNDDFHFDQNCVY